MKNIFNLENYLKIRKYKYFVPAIGLIFMFASCFNFQDSDLDIYYGEGLGLALAFYSLLVHTSSWVGLIFFFFLL